MDQSTNKSVNIINLKKEYKYFCHIVCSLFFYHVSLISKLIVDVWHMFLEKQKIFKIRSTYTYNHSQYWINIHVSNPLNNLTPTLIFLRSLEKTQVICSGIIVKWSKFAKSCNLHCIHSLKVITCVAKLFIVLVIILFIMPPLDSAASFVFLFLFIWSLIVK